MSGLYKRLTESFWGSIGVWFGVPFFLLFLYQLAHEVPRQKVVSCSPEKGRFGAPWAVHKMEDGSTVELWYSQSHGCRPVGSTIEKRAWHLRYDFGDFSTIGPTEGTLFWLGLSAVGLVIGVVQMRRRAVK